MPTRPCMSVTVACLLSLALSTPAFAGKPTIEVNEFKDGADADLGDGIVDADFDEPGEQRTLRAAIQHANVTPGADTITLPEGTYKLMIKGGEEDAGATGDLDILDDLTITGAGADTTIIKGKKAKDRIFDVDFDTTVTINDLTLLGGRADGGGGGGIRNFGDLTVNRCEITKCTLLSKTDDGGTIKLTNCTLAFNVSKADQNIFSGDPVAEGGSETVNMTNTILFGKKRSTAWARSPPTAATSSRGPTAASPARTWAGRTRDWTRRPVTTVASRRRTC